MEEDGGDSCYHDNYRLLETKYIENYFRGMPIVMRN